MCLLRRDVIVTLKKKVCQMYILTLTGEWIQEAPSSSSYMVPNNHYLVFGYVKSNLSIVQWLCQYCAAQMWRRRAELILHSRLPCKSHVPLIKTAGHQWWPPKWKIKVVANPPPVIRWHVERGEGEGVNKYITKCKCFCPCSDSVKELREQRIHNARVVENGTKSVCV